MLKKISLYSATILAVGSVVAVVMPQGVMFADTNSSTKTSTASPRELHATFSGELHEGMGVQPVTLGTVENAIPAFLGLDVINGGPESLSWSASVLNLSTGQLVSEWTEFKHGYNMLAINLDRTQIHSGDTLQLQLHANSGKGSVSIRV